IRDTLTGIYNRKGYNRLSEGIFKKARDEGKTLFVMVADLDQLKMINDNFGHMEGDNAITVAANALQTSCQLNEVCARIGGDEYAIVGCGDYSDEHISEHMEAVRSYFDRYNSSSGKKYEVGLSLGYFLGVPDKDSELDKYFTIADEMMYRDKVRRKKLREN
ncbi:MAG: GGDEF domain-containing protein, partial [Ruminococcus sp.]|nr:GGDEF domain-containing protein [Ruminococcus sp.]